MLGGDFGTSLIDQLERAATVVRNLSAPIRDAAAIADFEEVKEQIELTMERVVSEETYSDALRQDAIDSILNTVKFLIDQICLLKRDIANALLRQLSVYYQHEDGPAYVHDAIAREFGLSEADNVADEEGDVMDMSMIIENLPRTFAWMIDSVEYSDHLVTKMPIEQDNKTRTTEENAKDQDIVASSCTSSSASSSPESYKIPVTLRTGFSMPSMPNSPKRQSSESDSVLSGADSNYHSIPSIPEYFQLVVRLGIMKSVIGSSAALQEVNLPECFQFDLARVFEAQEMFQRLLVKACAILILKQRPLKGPSLSNEDMIAALHRLDVMLKSETSMDQIGSLIASLASKPGSFATAEEESFVLGLMRRALDSNGPTFTIVFNSIESTLQYLLRLGSTWKDIDDVSFSHDTRETQQDAGEKAARAELRKLGAADLLFHDVAMIAMKMAKMADINIAEHYCWFYSIYAFIRNHMNE